MKAIKTLGDNKNLVERVLSKSKLKSSETNCKMQPVMICFSHIRWNFVYQRPQHLISRFAKNYKVYFLEEPIFSDGPIPFLELLVVHKNLTILVPRVPHSHASLGVNRIQRNLLDNFIIQHRVNIEILWYYTPMSFSWTKHLDAKVMVYDCMDELSAFKFAPVELKKYEKALMQKADLVFTGGRSLYEAKKSLHKSVHAFPSSLDIKHFIQARDTNTMEPEDQRAIPYPRLGFYGVIDERFDINLVRSIAEARPEWHLVIIGPVVKIDEHTLPQLANIHYLGKKPYLMLPNYLSGWDVALLPFALNEATRFISPTKTPEYLAAGKCVVSTSIPDVISTYLYSDIVKIAQPNNSEDFIAKIEASLKDAKNQQNIFAKADKLLKNTSWDDTYAAMYKLISALHIREKLAC